MNRSTETRLKKLETVTDEQVSSIIVAFDRADAEKKLAQYKGDREPIVVVTGVPRDNMAKMLKRVEESGRSILDRNVP